MKKLFALMLLLPALSKAQQPVDTTTSRTRIYQTMYSEVGLYEKNSYDLSYKSNIRFTAYIVKNIRTNESIKGVWMYSGSYFTGSLPASYLDEIEIKEIIATMSFIKDSVDITKNPDHDTYIYYNTVDKLEVGVKARKGKDYQVYFRKKKLYTVDEETVDIKYLLDIYNALVSAAAFLDAHH